MQGLQADARSGLKNQFQSEMRLTANPFSVLFELLTGSKWIALFRIPLKKRIFGTTVASSSSTGDCRLGSASKVFTSNWPYDFWWCNSSRTLASRLEFQAQIFRTKSS